MGDAEYEPDQLRPLIRCPCGSDLVVVERKERVLSLAGKELHKEVDHLVWCTGCDGWTHHSSPPGITAVQIADIIDKAREGTLKP